MSRQTRCWLPPQGGTSPFDGSPWLFLAAPEGICIFGVTTVTEGNFPVVLMLSGIGKTETKTILSVTAERKTDTCHSCVTGSSLVSTGQKTRRFHGLTAFVTLVTDFYRVAFSTMRRAASFFRQTTRLVVLPMRMDLVFCPEPVSIRFSSARDFKSPREEMENCSPCSSQSFLTAR